MVLRAVAARLHLTHRAFLQERQGREEKHVGHVLVRARQLDTVMG